MNFIADTGLELSNSEFLKLIWLLNNLCQISIVSQIACFLLNIIFWKALVVYWEEVKKRENSYMSNLEEDLTITVNIILISCPNAQC